MRQRKILYLFLIVVFALGLGIYNLPTETQKQLAPWLPGAITDNKINLGLDLQGGSQLDYKIDLRKVPEKDRQSIIDGVINVLNKRVNGLGVSEPNIYPSVVGDENHIIVELAGIKDLEEAKKTVGKTIQLEFKEKRDKPDPAHQETVKKEAQAVLDKAKTGDIKVIGEEEAQANAGKTTFTEGDYMFADQMNAAIATEVFKTEPGKVIDKLIETSGEYSIGADGQLAQQSGYNIVKVLDKKQEEREIKTPRSVKVAHILVAYKGAERAATEVTRSDEDAKKRADEVIAKLKNGEKFEDLAKTYSDDSSNKDKGGVLDSPVTGKGEYVKEFEDAALALKAPNENTVAIKTSFGYHIIKALEIKDATDVKKTEEKAKIQRIFISSVDDQWQDTGLTGQQFQRADVEFATSSYLPHVTITFNAEGAKLFEEITGRNVNKQVAIFVGGQLISAPTVQEKIAGGKATITGSYTVEEANQLARDLNTGAIPAPITLAGQYTIGASLGQDALNKSLHAGLLGFLLVAIFMIAWYRLPGLVATAALFVYSMILIFLIKSSLPLSVSLVLSIGIFIFLLMKLLNSKDSAPEKTISLLLACFILFFLTFLLSTPIVLTLAGIAGVILSIGMAVDANILIFERVKEELRDGRNLSSAIEVGFDRAWNSIRDSNFSSLITCGILYYFGSSIIQGFAFNLAAGILVSMFTAITITKTLLNAFTHTKLAEKLWLFGHVDKKKELHLKIVQNRKALYAVSIALLIISLAGIPIFGIKAGMDFTGGALMEFKFEKTPTIDQIKQALDDSEKTVNQQLASKPATPAPVTPATPAATTTPVATTTTAITPAEDAKIELGSPHVVASDDNSFIIKTKHISADNHDLLITELKNKLGNFEEKRFVTVGATVGSSLQYKAILAVIIASIMIICYIALTFRKVPRSIGKWRFGISAIVALLHDLGIMIGIYVYLGAILGLEIDALFITAMLTVMGFSVHDTIVVFDRIREKLKSQRKDETFEEIANKALNETLGRSINTSFTVALSLLALVLFGGESIKYFNLALLIGIVCGTYSSIFIASPILVDWYNYSQKERK